MRKQHLDTFPVAGWLLERLGLGQRPGDVASFCVDAAGKSGLMQRSKLARGLTVAPSKDMKSCCAVTLRPSSGSAPCRN